ncbi:Hypothetical protein ORPV_495 [Orpheovirus IHUMI-LCC2]|uniref:Uncharacterized protein n=1 Tax=Orpheovirus IHUMI-LCC2 TaxID=2023057 RepID=A0A2I2L4K7_9VIRU|nr:Hypothetical protein ORPV_495 [Orpheovirus IHUMI-LCC2]SNW62399.1 Hypothetical protein ORPV_495 [Orpheovirus IHUMI-LCC2]
MSKLYENSCGHASQCKGCKLWYCANDEIHHCYNCRDNLDLCGKCTGLEVDVWMYLCRLCYKDDEGTMKCIKCNRYRRITKDPKPFVHSEIQDPICLSCHRKN